MKIAIDIDGTILPEGPTFDRYLKSPFEGAVQKVNRLVQSGHTVFFFTGRSWSEYDITYKWLTDNGFVFSYLICGKPIYDIFVDDRSINGFDRIENLMCKVPK